MMQPVQEMLLDLLSAGEAMELGTDFYQQYCVRDAMKRFFRKVRIFYANQPSVFTKILKECQTSMGNPDIKTEELIAFGQKYFKSNQALLDEYTTFISGVPYPENLLPEPEHVDLSDEEDEDKGVFDQFDKMEKISLLDGEDDLGSDTCPCSCHSGHNELRMNNRHP